MSVNYLPIRLKPFARFGFIAILWHMNCHQLTIAFFFSVIFFFQDTELPLQKSQSTKRSRLVYGRYPSSHLCTLFFYQKCCVECFSDFLFSWAGAFFLLFLYNLLPCCCLAKAVHQAALAGRWREFCASCCFCLRKGTSKIGLEWECALCFIASLACQRIWYQLPFCSLIKNWFKKLQVWKTARMGNGIHIFGINFKNDAT